MAHTKAATTAREASSHFQRNLRAVNEEIANSYKEMYNKVESQYGAFIKSNSPETIVEMGANHKGEIAELCEIANPDFGLITNIGHAHIEGFGSFEGVVETKSELYNYISKNKNGF